MGDLVLSNDRKTRFWPSQRNALGLLPGPRGTCPGATTGSGGCYELIGKRRTCYADRLASVFSSLSLFLNRNTLSLVDSTEDEMAEKLVSLFGDFEEREKKHGYPFLRLHWSGDVFNDVYARALARAVKDTPGVVFWTYTRSFGSVRYLAGIKNLLLYISADPVNRKEAEAVAARHNLPVCLMADAAPKGFFACPVDSGRMELEGGCAKCRACLRKTNIFFKRR